MKRQIYSIVLASALSMSYMPGDTPTRKSSRSLPHRVPEWYADNEWNVGLWGTYIFTNTDYNPNLDPADLIQSTTEGATVPGLVRQLYR